MSVVQNRLLVISGPCVVESRDMCLTIAERMKAICEQTGVDYVFKASYDKANRTSGSSFRGPGMQEGLAILAAVRKHVGVRVLTDIHESHQATEVAEVVDIIQIPAFLCRQTDLLIAAGATGKAVNIKKGQFLSPDAMKAAASKVQSSGCSDILLTERGTTFGYGDLVVDMRSISVMKATGWPVVFDGTHSVQKPSALGDRSGGDPAMVPLLCRSAIAAGCDALFLETHPNPAAALSDGANSMPLSEMPKLIAQFASLFNFVRSNLSSWQ